MSDPIANPPAVVDWTTNERITSTFLDRMGKAANRSLFHVLAWLFRDGAAGVPRSGFPGVDDCKVSINAGLVLEVAKGVGFYYDSAETDAFDTHYKPIWVPAVDVLDTLAAHDATNPRIDIVCLAPAVAGDESASVYVRNPTTRVTTTTTITTRSTPSYAVSVVTGTPAAAPTAPATPSGYLKIADVYVPAAAGAVTVIDARAILQFGDAFNAAPPSEHVTSFVPGSSTELEVKSLATPAMAVRVRQGEAVLVGTKGVRRVRVAYPASSLAYANTIAIAASDPTNPRIDLVYLTEAGVITVLAGTPGATPAEPACPANCCPLAAVDVGAAVTTITSTKVLDRRPRVPFPDAPVKATPTFTLAAGEAIALIQLKDYNGNAVARAGVELLIELFWEGDPAGPGATRLNPHDTVAGANTPTFSVTGGIGTQVLDSVDSTTYLASTDRNGQLQVYMALMSAATRHLKITPINTPGMVTFTQFIVP